MKTILLLLVFSPINILVADQMKTIQFQDFSLLVDPAYEIEKEDDNTLLIYPAGIEKIFIRLTPINSTIHNSPEYVANLISSASAKAGTKMVKTKSNKIYHSWVEKAKSGDDIRYWEIAFQQHYFLISATIVPKYKKDKVVLKAVDYVPILIDSIKALH